MNHPSNDASNYSTHKQQSSYAKAHLPHSRPNTALLTKKLKYINKLEDDESVKAGNQRNKMNNSSISVNNVNNQKRNRKGIMGNGKTNENNGNKSVNTA